MVTEIQFLTKNPGNLYVCSDCRRGASLVVTAIAEGRDCAARVDAQLMGSTSLPRAAPLAANPTYYQTLGSC